MKVQKPRARERRVPVRVDIACNDPNNGVFAFIAKILRDAASAE